MGPQEAECWAGALLGLLLLAAWLRRRGGGTDGSREGGCQEYLEFFSFCIDVH